MTRTIRRFGGVDRHVPVSPGVDREQAEAAGQLGAERKLPAQGDGGSTRTREDSARIRRTPHSHDHPEMFMVLDDRCRSDGPPMERYDMTVVAAHQPYGFVAGPEGLQSLVVRTAEASFAAATTGEHDDLLAARERTT